MAKNTKNSLIWANNRLIVADGLDDLLVVDTRDVLYIGKKGNSQGIKDVVSTLKAQGRNEVVAHMTVHRPWGSYTILEEGTYYKIKRISVLPGKRLSLQQHYHRSEHWTVVQGTAKVTNGDSTIFLSENQSTYIPKTAMHRLENPGKETVELIEVQTGNYLEEDDIVRFDDDFGRK